MCRVDKERHNQLAYLVPAGNNDIKIPPELHVTDCPVSAGKEKFACRGCSIIPYEKKEAEKGPSQKPANKEHRGGIVMNPKLDFIFQRRSVRKYMDREVPVEMIRDLLEAAMAAPSAVAKDPWHFIVLQDRKMLNKLADVLTHGQMLRQSTAAFVVCGDITQAHGGFESYMLQDLSAAVENILLAANALGLGTCWLGVHPRTERMAGIRELFKLPDHIIPMCGIAVGWPQDPPPARTRFNPDKVHWGKW